MGDGGGGVVLVVLTLLGLCGIISAAKCVDSAGN